MEKTPKPERKGYRGMALAVGIFAVGVATKLPELTLPSFAYGIYKVEKVFDITGRARRRGWEDLRSSIGYNVTRSAMPTHPDVSPDPGPEPNVENSDLDMDALMSEIGEELKRHGREGETPL